jgi:hypothetical protein
LHLSEFGLLDPTLAMVRFVAGHQIEITVGTFLRFANGSVRLLSEPL